MKSAPLKRSGSLTRKSRLQPRRKVKESEKGKRWVIRSDGREICTMSKAGRNEYRERTLFMAIKQFNRCAMCGKPFTEDTPPTFDHQDNRTAGHKDERTEIEGRPYNAAVHSWCNVLAGSVRYHWVDGLYVEVKKGEANGADHGR